MARVICVMFWVHAFGRVSLGPDSDVEATEYWFRIGVTGASALTLLCFLSIRPIRSRNYELFMYLHLVLGVIALAGAYIHSANFGYEVYIWPALFLWGLDRFLRLLRVSIVNSQLFKTRRVASDATVTVLSPHFLRILVDPPLYFLWRPGQSAYLTICGAYSTSITEAHPFTIANAPQYDKDGSARDEEVSEKDSSNEENAAGSGKEKESGGDNALDASRRLMFILRVRDGFTKRLVDSVLANHDSSGGVSKSFKAFVDGPYSSPPVVRGFEAVVFICGGSGISFALPLFLDLVRAARFSANPCCQRIVLVWAIRDPDQINWIAETVTHALSNISAIENSPVIDIRLHVTTAPEDTQSFDGKDRSSVTTDAEAAGACTVVGTDPNPGIARKEQMDPTAKERLLAVQGVSLIYGRPDIKGVLQTEIAEARGAVSVNVCGTSELAQSVRRALSGGIGARFMDVLRGGPSVLLHVEGFGNT
ncbi:ferric reductase NAD binding domain-containing protein [Mycena haematopus]|nr:ferric reductase NAD binding domain-containing protein [Mycena haematopus]